MNLRRHDRYLFFGLIERLVILIKKLEKGMKRKKIFVIMSHAAFPHTVSVKGKLYDE